MNERMKEKDPTLSSYFNSSPNTMKSNINDVDSIDGMNKHIIDKMQKKLLQEKTLRDKTEAALKLQDVVRRKLPLTTSTQQIQNDMLKARKQLKQDSAITIQNAIKSKKARTRLKQNKELKTC